MNFVAFVIPYILHMYKYIHRYVKYMHMYEYVSVIAYDASYSLQFFLILS